MTEVPPLENSEPYMLFEDCVEVLDSQSAPTTVDDEKGGDAPPVCQLCGERFPSVAELKHHVLVSYGGVEASNEETTVTTEGVGREINTSTETQEIPKLVFSRESRDQVSSDVFVTTSESRILISTQDKRDVRSGCRTNGTKAVDESTVTICIPALSGECDINGSATTIIEVDSDVLETLGDKKYFPHLLEQSQESDSAASATKAAVVLWEELPEELRAPDASIFPGEEARNSSAEHVISEEAETADNNLDASLPKAVVLNSHHQSSSSQNSRPMLPFMCEVCGKQFSGMQRLRCHIRIHTGEKPFKCGSCDESFRYMRTKKRHEESHSVEPKNRTNCCKICGKTFLRPPYLVEHLKTHTSEKPWKCEWCPKSFFSSSMLDRHGRSHIRKQLKDRSFLLRVNGKPTMIHTRTESAVRGISSTDAKIQENGDIAVETGEVKENNSAEDGIGESHESRDKREGCEDVAGGNLLATEELSAKRAEIKGLEGTSLIRWECRICAKSYCSKRALFQHSLVHSGEKKFKCSKCDAAFARRDVLKGHERSRHGEGPQAFPCNICDKPLKTRIGLKRHVAKHLGNLPFACERCPALFSDKRALMLHKATHSEERKYQCEECPATFKTGPGLRSHVLHCHVTEKPFSCSSCSANFSAAGSLRDHERTHVVDDRVLTVQRRHACPLCGKRFARAQTLLEHTFTHTGAKPSKCKVCGQGFASASNLKRHAKSHHVKTSLRCGICGERCSTRIMLRKHALTHAGVHPLLCHVCGKRFVFPHDLAVHARTHASNRVYTCEVCAKQFTNKSSYFGHKHTHKKWKGEYVSEEMTNDKLSSLLDELIEGIV